MSPCLARFPSNLRLVALLVCAGLASCAAEMPEPTAGYGEIDGALSAANNLHFGQTSTKTTKLTTPLTWTFQAVAGGKFALVVTTWSKKVQMLALLQRQTTSGSWLTVQQTAGATPLQLGTTPTSNGSYRLQLSAGKSSVGVTVQLQCSKGVCSAPVCPASPALAAELAKASLSKQIMPWLQGLLWGSESDYPFDVVGLPASPALAKTAPTPAELLKALALPATTPTEVKTPAALFAAMAQQGVATARIAGIKQVLALHGSQWTVIRTGTIQVQVYLIGRTACGALVGLHTVSIET